jgi:hypothetical protein
MIFKESYLRRIISGAHGAPLQSYGSIEEFCIAGIITRGNVFIRSFFCPFLIKQKNFGKQENCKGIKEL